MTERNWTCYCNADGEPWAIFLDGHGHDLRTLQSIACRKELRQAFIDFVGDDDPQYFQGDLTIARYWIRDSSDDGDDADPEYPWKFCEKSDAGACPITGVKFD